jgi:hypothetical protein
LLICVTYHRRVARSRSRVPIAYSVQSFVFSWS